MCENINIIVPDKKCAFELSVSQPCEQNCEDNTESKETLYLEAEGSETEFDETSCPESLNIENDVVNGIDEYKSASEENSLIEIEDCDTEIDDAMLTFGSHADVVLSCSLHPKGNIAATGSADGTVYIWNVCTGYIEDVITDHEAPVTEVHFSPSGKMLVTGDSNGHIQVFKFHLRNAGHSACLKRIQTACFYSLMWIRWHRFTKKLLAGSKGGKIFIMLVPCGQCCIIVGPYCPCTVGDLDYLSNKIITGYRNGFVQLWNINTGAGLMCITDASLKHHDAVTAITAHPNLPIYMSGDAEGKVIFYTSKGPVGADKAGSCVTCLEFSADAGLRLAACGTKCGRVIIWDYKNRQVCTLCDHSDVYGYTTCLKWINSFKVLVATHYGHIFCYDALSGYEDFYLLGHTDLVYDLQIHLESLVVVTASDDKTSKIFQLNTKD